MANSKKWTKKRHGVIFKILTPFFKLHFKAKYNLTAENNEDITPKPALIMCNHATTLDPFMLALYFKRPIYFITSDDLFTIPVVSPLIRWLVAPIPKAKSKSDLNTIRYTMKVLKEGGTVAVFPEGNRTLSGGNWNIDVSAAKLVKMCKVPLVLYNIKGGYGADPRWGRGVRRGKVTCGVVKIISAEQIEKMTVEEIYSEIVDNLVSHDHELGIEFKSKRRAEYLERALYYCPECKSFNTLYSEKDKIICKKCSFTAEYTQDLHIKKISGEPLGNCVKEWFDKQRTILKEYALQHKENLFCDQGLETRLIYEGKRHKIGASTITAKVDGVKIALDDGKAYDLDFSSLYGVAVLGKRKINFYLPDNRTLQLKGSKRFNSVKYLHLYELSKEK